MPTIDTGAFFGTTFPHLLLQCYRDLAPSIVAAPSTSLSGEQQEQARTEQAAEAPSAGALTPARLGRKIPHTGIYTPRIYGFRVSEFAISGPRMQWMRERPHSLTELEQT